MASHTSTMAKVAATVHVMRGTIDAFESWAGSVLAAALPKPVRRSLMQRLCDHNPQELMDAIGPRLNRAPDLDSMPVDLPVRGPLRFEHLAGLFASTSLDHGVISMTVRQAAYLYGLVRQMDARKVIEIGRYKGGSTLAIAAAMEGKGRFWSIDIGEKEARLFGNQPARRRFDEQVADALRRYGLRADLLEGDSRTIDFDSGEVDLVLIDGDHSLEGVRCDFERFGRRARVGGAVLLDDAFGDGVFTSHVDTVGRVLAEVIEEGEFKLVRAVNRMAHLVRVRAPAENREAPAVGSGGERPEDVERRRSGRASALTATNDMHLTFDIDPATLRLGDSDAGYVSSLYEKYWDGLVSVCTEMGMVRRRMIERGHSADFSDTEAELLYLLVREVKPNVVVEISPCHGYSTGYILSALTDNGHGKLFSYEIQAEVQGQPIADLIAANLSSKVDPTRLEVVVGDARDAKIPDCELLFLDSCHEAYFAAWFFSGLVSKPRLVFVHDVLIHDEAHRALVPKAAFLGVRDQYYVLQALAENHQRCFSVAAFARARDRRPTGALPARNPGSQDRSVVFAGHRQGKSATRMHATQARLHSLRQQIVSGDREGALAGIGAILHSDDHLFSKLQALGLLTQLGYRRPSAPDVFPEVDLDSSRLSVAELVAAMEWSAASADWARLRDLVGGGSRRDIASGTDGFLTDNYRRYMPAGLLYMPRTVLRSGWISKIARGVLPRRPDGVTPGGYVRG